MHHDRDDNPPELEGLDWALDTLRETPPVPPAWRVSLDAALSEDRALPGGGRTAIRSITRGGFVLRPLAALAAALVCMTVGAAAHRVLSSPGMSVGSIAPSPAPVATQLASYAAESMQIASAGTMAVRFAVIAPGARRVSVVGDFNGWNASTTPMHLARDGVTWTALMPLTRGRHTYAYVIDGDIVADPTAPLAADDDFGVPNSLLLVGVTP